MVLVFDHIPPESSGRGNSEGEYNGRQQVLDAFALGTGLVDEEREAAADRATLMKIAQVSWSCLNLATDGDMHTRLVQLTTTPQTAICIHLVNT